MQEVGSVLQENWKWTQRCGETCTGTNQHFMARDIYSPLGTTEKEFTIKDMQSHPVTSCSAWTNTNRNSGVFLIKKLKGLPHERTITRTQTSSSSLPFSNPSVRGSPRKGKSLSYMSILYFSLWMRIESKTCSLGPTALSIFRNFMGI